LCKAKFTQNFNVNLYDALLLSAASALDAPTLLKQMHLKQATKVGTVEVCEFQTIRPTTAKARLPYMSS